MCIFFNLSICDRIKKSRANVCLCKIWGYHQRPWLIGKSYKPVCMCLEWVPIPSTSFKTGYAVRKQNRCRLRSEGDYLLCHLRGQEGVLSPSYLTPLLSHSLPSAISHLTLAVRVNPWSIRLKIQKTMTAAKGKSYHLSISPVLTTLGKGWDYVLFIFVFGHLL